MNKELTNSIAKHIFNNLGITDKRNVSIISDTFITDHKIEFTNNDEEGNEYEDKTNVWIANGKVDNIKINIACSVFNIENDNEYCLMINIDNCPSYGVYYLPSNLDDAMIAFSIKENIWVQADIYFQATFLAGMEQFKDLTISFGPCLKGSQAIYNQLVSFIKYNDEMVS